MKIFTYVFNNPTYLEYQNKTLRKFIKEPFDFYCVDNSVEQKYTDKFKDICSTNGINYLKNLQPDHSEAGKSHYSALQWSWNNIISNTEELVIMMDHDTFPIDYISISELIGDAYLAGPPQARGTPDNYIEYFHPSLMIFDTKNLPNKTSMSFRGSVIDGLITDIGGDTHYYFKNNPNVKKMFLKAGHLHMDNPFFSPELIHKYGHAHVLSMSQTIFEMIENKFLHTRNGSNWDNWNKNMVENRNNFIFDILNTKLNA